MSESAIYLSGEILKRAKEKGISISNMALQKLLFIANGAYLAKTGEPLIKEPVEVWGYGPVIKSVYHEFKGYGNSEIRQLPMLYSLTPTKSLNEVANQAIDFALKIGEQLNAIQLSNWTHLPDSPWSKAKKENQDIIPNEYMEEYFKQFIKKE